MKGSNLLAFLGGAIVGGAIALLYAPQSGKKTREQIKDFVEDGVEDVKDFAGRTAKQVKKTVNHGISEAREAIDDVTDYVCREEKKMARKVNEKLEDVEKATR